MNILLILAGVADGRFPLHEIALANGVIIEGGNVRRVLSPFDEAALEVALKLRDKRLGTRLEVLVLGGPNSDALLRTVAAFKPDALRCLDLQPACLWDALFSARQIAGVLQAEQTKPDLVLIGREFGDLDDGGIPVLLAEQLGLAYFALAQHGEWREQQLLLMRENGASEEWLVLARPVLASVTNDKRNKLRHPLMKNVMEAKRLSFEGVAGSVPAAAVLPLFELAASAPVQRAGGCRLLEGNAREQARALLSWLGEQGVQR